MTQRIVPPDRGSVGPLTVIFVLYDFPLDNLYFTGEALVLYYSNSLF